MSHIDFACRVFPIEKVIKCSFAIGKTDFKVLLDLMKAGESDISSISNRVKKDRSTVQRSLKKLLDKNLIKRRQMNLESGGYIYVYENFDKDIIKSQIKNNLENFNKVVLSGIDKW